MTATRSPRWLMSFADLCLLLLGFFVLLHAQGDGHATAASVRSAFGGSAGRAVGLDIATATLFEPGEAVLRRTEARRLQAFGHALANGRSRIRIVSRGQDTASGRFDAWELAAARTAAIARAVARGGVSPRRIEIDLAQSQTTQTGQQVAIRVN